MDFLFWILSHIIEIFLVCLALAMAWLGYVWFCKWRLNSRIGKVDGFTVSYKLIGDDGETAIALDDKTKRICCFTNGRLKPVHHILSYKDLIGAELSNLTETITSTSTASQLGRGAVGGLDFGGLGALAGGLSGKQKHMQKTKRISLLLAFNDVNTPHIAIAIVSGVSIKSGGLIDNLHTKTANEWLARLQEIVKNNEKA